MELRRLPRPKLNTPIKVRDRNQEYSGKSLDINLTGMMCELPVEYSDTRPVLISFRLSPDEEQITTWASPIWSMPLSNGTYRVGIKFLSLDGSHYAMIADFVAAHWVKEHPVT